MFDPSQTSPKSAFRVLGPQSVGHVVAMLTQSQNEILKTYADLMSEAKARLSWIAHMVNGQSGLDPVIARESCDLQIRLICELIALCCLVVHGDIEEAKGAKFQKQWSAPIKAATSAGSSGSRFARLIV